jgi:hypothetical protein
MSAALPKRNEEDTGRAQGLIATGMKAGLQSIRNPLGLGPTASFTAVAKGYRMTRTRLPATLREFPFLKLGWVFAALILVSLAPLGTAQNPARPKNGDPASPSPAANAQAAVAMAKQEPLRSSPGERAKADAAELSDLADQLRDQLHGTDINILSLNIIQKTEAIGKLAKKIKGEANGH